MLMLAALAWLAAKRARERWAVFLWTFATWDAFYYLFLFLTIHWPPTLATTDILFLIPSPWYASVWFPLLIDTLILIVILESPRELS